MSELEKQQREEYKRKRKKLILIQAIIALILTLTTVVLGSCYAFLNKSTYVDYTQDGKVVHKAYLEQNDFYEQDYINGKHAYVTELIKYITADFEYNLDMNAENVSYKYTYKIDAQIEIRDSDSNFVIYDPIYSIVPEKTNTVENESSLYIRELAEIDYHKFDRIAKDFVVAYGLNDTQNELKVRMYIDVVGVSEQFASDSADNYVIELVLPLITNTVTPTTLSTVPSGEQRVLATNSNAKFGVLISFILFALFAFASLSVLTVFSITTRDKHIDYARRVQKILSSYKSYIQKIINPFDTGEYQVLYLSKFTEMLEIRDTLQMPILMYENEDKTCSSFFIATTSKVLYLFEIKVEEDDVAEEPIAEEVIEAPVAAEPEVVEVIEEIPVEDKGVEVIDVVWPEHEGREKNRSYRYDPDGEVLENGDVVLVPSIDKESGKDITRNATVKNGNYRIDPSKLVYPLKKIIGVVKRKS